MDNEACVYKLFAPAVKARDLLDPRGTQFFNVDGHAMGRGKFNQLSFLRPDFRVESADPTSAHVRSAQLLITLSKNIPIKDVSRGYRIPKDWISLLRFVNKFK